MWQWITVIKEGTCSFVQSLKCFEKVNNYDIEYKLQSRMLSHQVTSYYAREKNKYISYYVWGSDDKFSTLGHSQCISSHIKMNQILYQSLGVGGKTKVQNYQE